MRVLDLFSGIGGFSLGLERAGMETVAFCEIETYPSLVLNARWPNIPVYNDVKTLTAEQLRTDGITVDVICGGFPCQDISLAGKGGGLDGERSGLWSEFHRLIKEIQPKYAIIENVSALRSRGLDQVLRSLAEIGYDAEWHCIPASAVGAPHRRDRIWIVAYPSNGERETGTEEQGILRSLSRDRAINDNLGGRSATHPTDVAYPSIMQQHGGNANTQAGSPQISEFGNRSGSDAMADTMQSRLEGQRDITSRISEKLKDFSYSSWWAIEPDVGRVAHGVRHRSHRLKALGNAVVPQIPQLIGEAILNAPSHRSGN